MIHFETFTLDNGLQVVWHEVKNNPIAAFNLMYNVGSRDEEESKTGFAHLFEHLMFGGSANVPSYDTVVDESGGSNNAFTSPDLTNYYITLPVCNIERAFWLESDRMSALSINEKTLEVQRKVVIEEFKQRYLNQPYGDVWLKLRPFVYQKHPYRWATIGKEISHIEKATLEDVRAFFKRYYCPDNAVLSVAADISFDKVRALSEKWFSDIPAGGIERRRSYPQEEAPAENQLLRVEADVPDSVIYKVFRMCERFSPDYHATDLLSDILGRDKSARLQRVLVSEKRLFTSVKAYVTGSLDSGMLVLEGKLAQGVRPEDADAGIQAVLDDLLKNGIEEKELQKVKNQAEFAWVAANIQSLNRAMNLAFFALYERASAFNEEAQKIQSVTCEDVMHVANDLFGKGKSFTMYYMSAR
jgi:zinc protease